MVGDYRSVRWVIQVKMAVVHRSANFKIPLLIDLIV